MSIAEVRVRSVGVDVSIAGGILMLIWRSYGGKLSIKMSVFFILLRADMSIAGVRVRSVGADVSIAREY